MDLCAWSGLRVFLASSYASERWRLPDNWRLQYAWDEAASRVIHATRHSCHAIHKVFIDAQLVVADSVVLMPPH